MKSKLIIILLLHLFFQSCSIQFGEKIMDKSEVKAFLYNDYNFVKLDEKTFNKITDKNLFIVNFYKYNCQSHNQLIKNTFEEYKKVKSNYKLIVVFTDNTTPLNKQLEYLSQFYTIKDLYYLDFEKYRKGNLHKKFENFLCNISGNECVECYNKNFVIKFNAETKKCF